MDFRVVRGHQCGPEVGQNLFSPANDVPSRLLANAVVVRSQILEELLEVDFAFRLVFEEEFSFAVEGGGSFAPIPTTASNNAKKALPDAKRMRCLWDRLGKSLGLSHKDGI